MGKLQVQKTGWWHEHIVDWMFCHPDQNLKACAEYFGVSPQTIYLIKNSDAFKDYFRRRRDAHAEALSAGVIDKAEALAELGLDVMTEKVERERESLGLPVLKEVTEMAMKALGMNGHSGPVQQTNIVVAGVSQEQLAAARAKLAGRRPETKVIEAQTEQAVAEEVPLPATT